MTLAHLVPLAIGASMFLVVFAMGLTATVQEATHLFRHPMLLFRAVLSMNVVMVALAVAISLLLKLDPVIKIALVTLALSPVPPILPLKQEKAGGSTSYTIGLLVGVAVVAIVLVPLSVKLLSLSTGVEMHMPFLKVLPVILLSIVAPLSAGIAVKLLAPALAGRILRPVSIFAVVLLVAACLPVLFTAWPTLWRLVGNGVVLCLALFTLIGVAVGHALGGPNADDRTVLALATGTRHPGVAIAIANVNFPNEKAVLAVVFYHLVIGAIVSVPYVKWRTRMHAAAQTRATL